MYSQLLNDQLLEQIVSVSKQAGDRIVEYFKNGYEVETKADNSPLTSADIAADTYITDQLFRITPEIPILSEESTRISYVERSQWRTYWLIDPLDGTREFVKGIPDFTVNIALIDEHRPVLGVINIPMQQVTYKAMLGSQACKESADGSVTEINTRSFANVCPTVCSSRSAKTGKNMQKFLAGLGKYELLSRGSSLKSCLVAEGVADVYPRFGPTSEWDTAAAQCILEVAGGQLMDMQLQPLRYNKKDSLLNPHFIAVGDRSVNWSKYLD